MPAHRFLVSLGLILLVDDIVSQGYQVTVPLNLKDERVDTLELRYGRHRLSDIVELEPIPVIADGHWDVAIDKAELIHPVPGLNPLELEGTGLRQVDPPSLLHEAGWRLDKTVDEPSRHQSGAVVLGFQVTAANETAARCDADRRRKTLDVTVSVASVDWRWIQLRRGGIDIEEIQVLA